MHMFGFDRYGMGGGGMFIMILFWVVTIVAIYYILKSLTEKDSHTSQETAEEILKKRYAKGEISLEEYEKIKENIK